MLRVYFSLYWDFFSKNRTLKLGLNIKKKKLYLNHIIAKRKIAKKINDFSIIVTQKNHFQPSSVTLERRLSSIHSLLDFLGQVPEGPPSCPWTAGAPVLPETSSLTQHPPPTCHFTRRRKHFSVPLGWQNQKVKENVPPEAESLSSFSSPQPTPQPML